MKLCMKAKALIQINLRRIQGFSCYMKKFFIKPKLNYFQHSFKRLPAHDPNQTVHE